MRAAAFLTVALCACACNGRGTPGPAPVPVSSIQRPATLPDDLGDKAYAHVATLVGLGPRHSGTPGWQQGIDHIVRTLKSLGIETHVDAWHDDQEDLDFQNITATIPGRRSERIVLGAHHDTKRTKGPEDPEHDFEFVGANDSGSGVGLLLAVAEYLVAHQPEDTIELAFFDGEESVPWNWDVDRALFGSKRFVKEYERARQEDPKTPPIVAMVLLDMVGARDLQIDEESLSDPGLIAIFRAAAKAVGHSDVFFTHRHQVSDDHKPFLDAGIPAIDLIDLYDNPQWHTAEDTLENISARSLQKVGEVLLTALPAIAARFGADRSGH